MTWFRRDQPDLVERMRDLWKLQGTPRVIHETADDTKVRIENPRMRKPMTFAEWSRLYGKKGA